MSDQKKVVVVMPAYNAAETLKKTFDDIPEGYVDEVILVDDKSSDDTVKVSESLGIHTVAHEKNRGYGGNQKTCYTEALKRGADIVIMVHPDYQYDSRLVPYIIGFIEKDVCDVVLGTRIRTRKETLEMGMPIWKYISNRLLTITENIIFGQNVTDFHTGYRAYSREVLETIPFLENSEDFVFDTEFLAQTAYFNFRIGCVPVPVRYFPEASQIDFKDSTIYGLKTVMTLFKFLGQKFNLVKSPLFVKSQKQL
jgi:glycosyltransferase involved in cell wall biosynthesis